AAEAAGKSAETTGKSPVAIVCVGMAGSGKTTFMRRINSYLHGQNDPPYIINLDPAVLNVPFESNIDIRDSVNYQEVMKQYNLGPNGGILTSLNLFATKVDQIVNLLEKRTTPDPSNPQKKPVQHILVDTPGQIEVFVWSASGTILLESLASSFPTVIAYIIDTPRTASTNTFISNMLYACSILYKTKLPMILVFNKTDVQDASFAKEWMTDFEAFQAAVQEEQFGDGMGEGGPGGSGYISSLTSSMSLVLEEFYSHLSFVPVSSRLGTGMEEFFAAVQEKAEEFKQDYLPELQRRRQERDEQRRATRKGMSVNAAKNKNKDGDDIDPADDVDDDDIPDDESDREGLQSRYEAALTSEQDSIMADASFAKYLHNQ
ncbi:hypothetical protein ACRALDRAFT_2087883, partial [Sodiomyces alcalophilus JCM 7366]|uniref:uncharacterized protein n=1 Tax=Sodiomyces alcalophilus JCM 7366 TaxID=591952 RepID=UPI0039B474EE